MEITYQRDVIANAIYNYMQTIEPLMNGTVHLRKLQTMDQGFALADAVLTALQKHHLYIVGTGAIDPRPKPPPLEASEHCELSQRVDGKVHSWVFDGDDPYVICVYCDEMRDALSNRVIRSGRVE